VFSEVFDATRVGQPTCVSSILPNNYSLQVSGRQGVAPSAQTTVLQGSNDLVNWTTLISHAGTTGAVAFMADGTPRPVRWLRLNCTALTLGSAPDILAVAVASA